MIAQGILLEYALCNHLFLDIYVSCQLCPSVPSNLSKEAETCAKNLLQQDQVLVVGTKQSRQADKAGQQGCQAG